MRTEAQIAGNGATSRGSVTNIGRAISAQDRTTDATRGCCSTETSPSTRKSQSSAKRGLEPQDYECQQAAAARDLGQNIRPMDRDETRMRRSYQCALEICTSSRP
jgi:hypothetical protein